MSNVFSNFLSDIGGGLFADSGYLRDYQHAARLYVDSYYGMAPKAGWSYFIEFGLNPRLPYMFKSLDVPWYEKTKGKIGLVAKSSDLPRFTVGHSTINSYNRKKIIQNKITYNPINITFHDDMDNMTTNLWKNYYQYYYADSRYERGTTFRGGLKAGRSIETSEAFNNTELNMWRAYSFGLNNGQTEPFFKYIKIFLLNRRSYNSITLLNPLITEWGHSQLDNSQTKMLENKMTVAYEAVYYDTAKKGVSKTEPGFNQLPYDNTKSPLRAGRGGGISGLIGGTGDLLGNVAEGLENGFTFGDVLQLAKDTQNLKKNYDDLKKAGGRAALAEAYSILGSVATDAARGRGAFEDTVNPVATKKLNTSFYTEQVSLYQRDPETGDRVFDSSGQAVPFTGQQGTQRQSLWRASPRNVK